MAERRMFSKTIIDSDLFLDMSLSAQALYFHLVLKANNKGLLNNFRSICHAIGANISCRNELFNNGFICEDGEFIKINHWNTHNESGIVAKKRLSYRYRKVRKEALIRDCYTCICGITKKIMDVHHIKSFSKFKDLRYSLDNLITLCPECHKKLHEKERIFKNG